MNPRLTFNRILGGLIVFIIVLTCFANAEDIDSKHGKFTGENNDVIDMMEGTLNISEADFTLPGRGGLDVVISRVYSSDVNEECIPTTETISPIWGEEKPHGIFGPGWNYLIGRIHDDTIYYADGSSEDLFYPYPADPYSRKKTRQYSLVHGDTLYALNGIKMYFGVSYTFADSTDDSYYGGKYVNKIFNAYGDSITIEYYQYWPFIKKIRDSIGRFVWFEYSEVIVDTASFCMDSRLRAIKYLNWSGDTLSIQYSYSKMDSLLTKVKYPSGDSILYSYTDSVYYGGAYFSNLPIPRLSQITNINGGVIQYDWKAYKRYKGQDLYPTFDVDFCSTFTDILDCITYCDTTAVPCTLYCDTTFIYYGYDYYSFICNPRIKTRIYNDSSSDQILFTFDYPTSFGETESQIEYPNGLTKYFTHYQDRNPNDPPRGYDGSLYFATTIGDNVEVDRSLILPGRDERIGTVIGSDTAVYTHVSDYIGWEVEDTDINEIWHNSIIKSGFNVNTGEYSKIERPGKIDSTSVYWDTTSNRVFMLYERKIDNTGSYDDTTEIFYVWDYDEYEIDAVINKFSDEDSIITYYFYDDYGNKIKEVGPQGDTLYYEYSSADSSAFLTRTYWISDSSTEIDINKFAYYFNSGAIKWEISANDDTTFYYYDSYNRLLTTKRPLETGDWTTKSVYDKRNHEKIDSVHIGNGNYVISKSKFNEHHWPVQSQNQSEYGNIFSYYEYDNMGRVYRTSKPDTSSTDTLWTEIIYDTMGRKVKTNYPGGLSDSTYYTPLRKEIIDANGHKRKTVLNQYLQTDYVVFDTAYSDTIKYEYGPWGKVIKETDPRGMVKQYWYDDLGRLYADSSADKGKRFYYYDKGNNLRLSKDADGVWLYYKYDKLGRDIEMGYIDDPDTTQVDDRNYPSSNYTALVTKRYDSYVPVFGSQPAWVLAYNPIGNLTEIRDESGYTRFYHDDRNRLALKRIKLEGLPDTLEIYYEYNNADQLVKVTYPDGSEVNYEYDAYGKLINIPGFIENSDSTEPGIIYKSWGALDSVYYFGDSDYFTQYEYDSNYRVSEVYAKNDTTKIWGQSYIYDNVGNVTQIFNLLKSTGIPYGEYEYDYKYQMIGAEYNSMTKTDTYSYDNNGNREMLIEDLVGGDVDTTYYYYNLDSLYSGQLTPVSFYVIGDGYFDHTDTLVIVPANAQDTISWSVTFDADVTNPLLVIRNSSTTFVTVDTIGIYTGRFVPSSTDSIEIIVWLDYDPSCDDDVCSGSGYVYYYAPDDTIICNHNSLNHTSTQSDNNYIYDSSGRLIADSSGLKTYSYNQLDQLSEYYIDGNKRLGFAYNYAGQRVAKILYNGNNCDSPDSCSLAGSVCDTIATGDCAYIPGDVNNDGSLNDSDVSILYSYIKGKYEIDDPLSRADVNCDGVVDGSDVTYLASYFKSSGLIPAPSCCYWNCPDTVITYYIYSGGQVIAEYDSDGNLICNYVYGMGKRIGKYWYDSEADDTIKYVYHSDHLGSMRAITDEEGATVALLDYDPFGTQKNVTGSPGTFTYNGNEFDDEWDFDLYYYGARYMDPSTGRFITPDPIDDFLNPYSYVGNNPMNMIDPTGMLSLPIKMYPVIQAFLGSMQEYSSNDQIEMMSEKISDLNSNDDLMGYIRNLARIAENEAKKMASSTSNEILKNHYEMIADAMKAIYDGSVSINIGSFNDPTQTVHEFDRENGTVSIVGININKQDFLGGEYTNNDLIGFLIHEGSHMASVKQNNDYFSFYRDNRDGTSFDNISDLKDDANKYYKYESEKLAYTSQFDYYSRHRSTISQQYLDEGTYRMRLGNKVRSNIIKGVMISRGYGDWIDQYGWYYPY